MAEQGFECGYCSWTGESREQLVQHNVREHAMSEEESRNKVMEKYPQA